MSRDIYSSYPPGAEGFHFPTDNPNDTESGVEVGSTDDSNQLLQRYIELIKKQPTADAKHMAIIDSLESQPDNPESTYVLRGVRRFFDSDEFKQAERSAIDAKRAGNVI